MTQPVDLTDLDLWLRGVPNQEFARLRREAPVAWLGEPALKMPGTVAFDPLVTLRPADT